MSLENAIDSAHKELERLELWVVKDLPTETTSNRDRLFESHRLRNLIDTITSTTKKLNRENREYQRREPAASVVDPNEEFDNLLKEEPVIKFTGEMERERMSSLLEVTRAAHKVLEQLERLLVRESELPRQMMFHPKTYLLFCNDRVCNMVITIASTTKNFMERKRLEVTLAAHAKVEQLERLIVKDLRTEPTSDRDRFFQSHRVRNMIDTITSTTMELVEIYEDSDGVRKDEIAALGDQTATGTNEFTLFYDRLKEIREYYGPRGNPVDWDLYPIDPIEEFDNLLKERPVIEFSREEAFGRHLDLHKFYLQYRSCKFGELEYSEYLDVFSQLKISHKMKMTMQYKDYMKNLLEYLKHFFGRIEPLQDLHRIISEIEAHVEEKWAKGTLEDWEDEVKQKTFILAQNPLPNVPSEGVPSKEELRNMSRETLVLLAREYKLKIGGTPDQLIKRLLSVTDHALSVPISDKHKGSSNDEKLKEIALLEAKMKKFCDLLNETIERTKQSAKKKQAKQKQVMTYEEIEAESEDTILRTKQAKKKRAKKKQESEAERLYWEEKLGGPKTNKKIKFICELCGYCHWQRKAFEEHTMSRPHAESFTLLDKELLKGITKREEAYGVYEALYEAQRNRRSAREWNSEKEEFEDEDGNIFTKKLTYYYVQNEDKSWKLVEEVERIYA